MRVRSLFLAAAGVMVLAAPLHAQRARRSSGAHKGIPCGHSYISASKTCHIAAATTDSSSTSAGANDGLDTLSTAQLEARAGAKYQAPAWTSGIRAPAAAASDLDAVRRERDSLRIVVAALKSVCTQPSHN